MKNPIRGLVEQPCTYGWDNMEGSENVRFCKVCKLNVYNISNMTEEEAQAQLNASDGSTCVRMRTRADGTVYTDNCPYRLRRVRNMLRRYAPALLFVCAWAFSQSVADAQGLIGAPVDGRYGQSNEITQAADLGYDAARDCSRLATAVSLMGSAALGAWRNIRLRPLAIKLLLDHEVSFQRVRSFIRRRRRQTLLIVIAIPAAVHLIGTYLINTFGGLSSGL